MSKFIKTIHFSMLLPASLICFQVKAEQLSVQEKNLNELIELSVGEFNNFKQIDSQEKNSIKNKSEAANQYSRLHHIRQKINSPQLEGHWIYAQLNRLDRDGDIYRQSYIHYFINENNEIKSRNYKLAKNSKVKILPSKEFLNSLTLEQLSHGLPNGCDTHWQRELNQFRGLTDFNTCLIDSKYKNEKRRIFAEEIIGQSGFWGREGGYTLDGKLAFGLEAPNYYRYQRARPMTCWAAVRLGDDDWKHYPKLKTHDEGGSIKFGPQKQYRLQLKQTESDSDDQSQAFEIFIYRNNEEKALASRRAEAGTKHIALTSGEVQASCKLATANSKL